MSFSEYRSLNSTPPRLPVAGPQFSSPTSARLRAIAPTPVKVPRTPILVFSPYQRRALGLPPLPSPPTLGSSITLRDQAEIGLEELDDPFEYEYETLDLDPNVCSDQRARDETRDALGLGLGSGLGAGLDLVDIMITRGETKRRNSSFASTASIPLLFDEQGHVGTAALQLHRASGGPDVPGLPSVREGNLSMSPKEYMSHCVPRPILIEFDDVFASTPGQTRMTTTPHSRYRRSTPSYRRSTQTSPLNRERTRPRMDREESFATFGFGVGRRASSGSEEGWTYSLSAYGSDDEGSPTRSPRPHPQLRYGSPRCMELDDEKAGRPPMVEQGRHDSTFSVAGEELVTPDSVNLILPSQMSSFSDTPTPKASTLHDQNGHSDFPDVHGGLQLSLGRSVSQRDNLSRHVSDRSEEAEAEMSKEEREQARFWYDEQISRYEDQKAIIHPKFDTPHTKPRRLSLGFEATVPSEDWVPLSKKDREKEKEREKKKFKEEARVRQEESDKVKKEEKKRENTVPRVVPFDEVPSLENVDKEWMWLFGLIRKAAANLVLLLNTSAQSVHQSSESASKSPFNPPQNGVNHQPGQRCFKRQGVWSLAWYPRNGQSGHFTSMEGLPVLRRIVLNGRDNFDWSTRHATLQIRNPGIYAVHGSEDRDKGRVEWKFTYMVQSRISPSTGEIVLNERVVIPLAFYATPSFFNPSRAQKLHIVHLIKKTITPNIVAETIQPPHVGRPPSTLPIIAPPTPEQQPGPVQRTLEAIVNAVIPNRPKDSISASPTPMRSIFGTRPSSRGRAQTPNLDSPNSAPVRKKEGRKRSTSLFAKLRPFTPPRDISALPPLPTSIPKASASTSSLHLNPQSSTLSAASLPLPVPAPPRGNSPLAHSASLRSTAGPIVPKHVPGHPYATPRGHIAHPFGIVPLTSVMTSTNTSSSSSNGSGPSTPRSIGLGLRPSTGSGNYLKVNNGSDWSGSSTEFLMSECLSHRRTSLRPVMKRRPSTADPLVV